MIVIAGMLAFLFIVGLIVEKIFESIKNNLLKQSLPGNQLCETNTIIKPFSTTEYFERIEKAYNEILEQKERQSDLEEYVIILWLGLDGLRLNKDGSSEWISKRPVATYQSIFPESCDTYTYYPPRQINYQLQQCCCTMDYINSLQAQNQQLQFQIAQSQQKRIITETIQGGYGNNCKSIIGIW